MSKTPSRSPLPSLSDPSTSRFKDLDSQLAESQLLSELAQAAESVMVPVRAYDHASEKVESKLKPKTVNAALRSKKRDLEDQADGPLKQSPSKRQRRAAGTTNADTPKHSPAPVRGSGKSLPAEIGEQVVMEKSTRNQQKTIGALAKHRRFGSEELEFGIGSDAQPAATHRDEELGNEDDSDDAPEAITATAGFEASHAAATDAAKTAELQQTALRAKRREHDARLKAQAEAAKLQQHSKRSNRTVTSAADSMTNEEVQTSTPQTASNKSTQAALPALLPDDLLTEELLIRPPEASPPVGRHILSKKTKLLDIDKNAPRDIKRGNRRIRVAQVERSILPPKSSSASKAIREKWLMGQRGSLGAAGVPRRKLGGGFVRR